MGAQHIIPMILKQSITDNLLTPNILLSLAGHFFHYPFWSTELAS